MGLKVVLFPITVPEGDYCWKGDGSCPNFDYEGGHSHCKLDMYPLKSTKEGYVIKPEICKNLRINK